MNNTRFSLQSILLSIYLTLIIAMIANIIYDSLLPQKNEILPASICLVIFVVCLVSGFFNVFYHKKIDKSLLLTFMFYLLLPISLPLLVLEIKNKDKFNQESFKDNSSFTKRFIIITTILQIIELLMLIGFMLNFLLSNSRELINAGWYFLIPISLILFGLVASWVYYSTQVKFFKFLMIFNFQFGLPWFFLTFILSKEEKKQPI